MQPDSFVRYGIHKIDHIYSHTYIPIFNEHFSIFNEHFSTVGERLVNNATPRSSVDENIHLTPINSLEGKCTLPDITEEYVQKEISSMSVGKATGPDGISVKMLQIASRYITKSLTHIFNLSIRCEHYPKEWKYALVTPIHKGGDKCNTTNYRPISILPIISKILERWVHSVVYSYLDECNLIPCCQSGFRSQHSTETTLHDLTNTCYQAMERGEMTGTVFIDLSKAFDSVNHDIILDKLEKSNMSTSVINWFKSYLYERSQSVTIDPLHDDVSHHNNPRRALHCGSTAGFSIAC